MTKVAWYSCQLLCSYTWPIQARISKDHEILEIGCGWGTLAIEVVQRTGCKYTGITLSEEQLKYAEMKVKEAGLQVRTGNLFLLKHNMVVSEINLFFTRTMLLGPYSISPLRLSPIAQDPQIWQNNILVSSLTEILHSDLRMLY